MFVRSGVKQHKALCRRIKKHWHSSRAETPPPPHYPPTPPSSPLNASCNESLIGSSAQPRRHSHVWQSASVNIELSSKYWIHDWLNNSIWRLWRADAHEAADWITKQRSCASPCSPPALPWQTAGGCLILSWLNSSTQKEPWCFEYNKNL